MGPLSEKATQNTEVQGVRVLYRGRCVSNYYAQIIFLRQKQKTMEHEILYILSPYSASLPSYIYNKHTILEMFDAKILRNTP